MSERTGAEEDLERGQCSAEHQDSTDVHYCVRNAGHGSSPHRCYFGHEWRTPPPTAEPSQGDGRAEG